MSAISHFLLFCKGKAAEIPVTSGLGSQLVTVQKHLTFRLV